MGLLYIDLFSGCGGLALGFQQAGIRGLFAIEKNIDAFSTLKYNLIDKKHHFLWPTWLPCQNHDINDVLSKYEKELQLLKGHVPVLAGGPPCQGFSSAGRRQEDDIRNSMIDSYLKFIDIIAPEYVFLENVKGFTQDFSTNKTAGKNYSNYTVEELEKRGYKVAHRIINFANYGIPQSRRRFILFASKHGKPNEFFKILRNNSTSFLKCKGLPQRPSLSSAISDLRKSHGIRPCPDSPHFSSGIYGKPVTKYQRYMKKKGMTIPDSHRFANHQANTIERFRELQNLSIRNSNLSNILEENFDIKKNCFIVLDGHRPAPTLTTNPDDYAHYSEPRTMTVREYARIQSFPDTYEFKGSYTTGGKKRKEEVPRYSQIGNAIPPLFAEQVGLALIEYANKYLLIKYSRYCEIKKHFCTSDDNKAEEV